MEDRRFDALTKALAKGANRRSVLKGLLGLGAAAVTGTVLDEPSRAARRPSPTPRPHICPGNQTWNGSHCVCPTGLSQCNPGSGPACCNDQSPVGPGYSECCDNACCHYPNQCVAEELCCPRLPDVGCLDASGRCCATLCEETPGGVECCPAGDFCPGGTQSPDLCCDGNDTCCGASTAGNACTDLSDDDHNCGACGNVCGGCSTCQNGACQDDSSLCAGTCGICVDGVCQPDPSSCLACETCTLDDQSDSYICVDDCTGCAECQPSQLNPAGNCFPIDDNCLSCQVCELDGDDTGGICENTCDGCGNCVADPNTGNGACVADDTHCTGDDICCPGTDTCVPAGATCCASDAQCGSACETCDETLGYCVGSCAGAGEACCTGAGIEQCCLPADCHDGVGCCDESDFCPGGESSDALCCVGPSTCCGSGTNANDCNDLQHDDLNCGGCGIECTGCAECIGGECTADASECGH